MCQILHQACNVFVVNFSVAVGIKRRRINKYVPLSEILKKSGNVFIVHLGIAVDIAGNRCNYIDDAVDNTTVNVIFCNIVNIIRIIRQLNFTGDIVRDISAYPKGNRSNIRISVEITG